MFQKFVEACDQNNLPADAVAAQEGAEMLPENAPLAAWHLWLTSKCGGEHAPSHLLLAVWKGVHLVLMDEILHHLGALNYCNSQDFMDVMWCKISSINSMMVTGTSGSC